MTREYSRRRVLKGAALGAGLAATGLTAFPARPAAAAPALRGPVAGTTLDRTYVLGAPWSPRPASPVANCSTSSAACCKDPDAMSA